MQLFLLDHFLLQLVTADQETADGEQTGDTGDGCHIGPGILVTEDDMAGDSHSQNLQNVGGSGVNEHTHKLQTDHDGQQIVQHMAYIIEISGFCEHLVDFQAQGGKQCQNGQRGNEALYNMQHSAEKMLRAVVVPFQLFQIFPGFRIQLVLVGGVVAQGHSSSMIDRYILHDGKKKGKNNLDICPDKVKKYL